MPKASLLGEPNEPGVTQERPAKHRLAVKHVV